MRKWKLIVALPALLLLATLAATPAADATRVKGGDQVMVLNQDQATGEFGVYGCSELAWFGSIDIKGRTYGMALYPLPGGSIEGTTYNYVEAWKIWTGHYTVSQVGDSDQYVVDDCTPGRVLAAGTDEGVADLATGVFSSEGTTDWARRSFRSWLGRRVHQEGQVQPIDFDQLSGVTGFLGRLDVLEKTHHRHH